MFTKRFHTVLGAVAMSALLVAVAESVVADIIPVAQTRSVDASASAAVPGDSDSDDDSESAADFGPFNVEVDSLTVAIAGGIVAISQAIAGQDSALGASMVSASGDSAVNITLLAGNGSSGAGDGDSLFEFEFFVDVPSSYVLSGLVDTSAIVTGGAAVPLLLNDLLFEDLDNALVLFQALTNDEVFAVAGVLAPGNYRLFARATANADQASSADAARTVSGSTRFELEFGLTPLRTPEPGSLALLALGILACGARLRSRRA